MVPRNTTAVQVVAAVVRLCMNFLFPSVPLPLVFHQPPVSLEPRRWSQIYQEINDTTVIRLLFVEP